MNFLDLADKLYHNLGNPGLIACLPPLRGSKVLDLGCGAGSNATAMERAGAIVYGVTLSRAEAGRAAGRLHGVVVADLVRSIPISSQSNFDIVVMSHILEHLTDPVALLREARRLLAPAGVVAVAVPSVTHYSVRLSLLRGRWTYAEAGTLDWTHLRFFSRSGILEILRRAGYDVQREGHDGTFPLWRVRALLPKSVVEAINRLSVRLRPELFATQFIFLLKPR